MPAHRVDDSPEKDPRSASRALSWKRVESSSHPGRFFFHNSVTGASQWQEPEGFNRETAVSSAGQQGDGDEGNDARESDAPEPRKWKGWQAVWSRSRNRWYYHHAATKQSVWMQPAGWGGVQVEEVAHRDPMGVGRSVSDVGTAQRKAQGAEPRSRMNTMPTGTLEVHLPPSSPLHSTSLPPKTPAIPGKQPVSSIELLVCSEQDTRVAARLSRWLAADDPVNAFHCDNGDFGRPLTPEGVQKCWDGLAETSPVTSRTAYLVLADGEPAGHIEVHSQALVDPSNAWCHWSGVPRFSLLAYVYVLPKFRGAGVGSRMVKRATQVAFETHKAQKVLLMLEERNLPLLRFYSRLGYTNTDQTFWRKNLAEEDVKLLCLQMLPSPD
eukprot:Hpha_TRINITY_DN12658_c0_g1::TRINITY_DN12658_c0_g1_i1::g.49567::m.49567